MYLVLQRLLYENQDADYINIQNAFTNETFKIFFKQAFDPSNNESVIIDLMKASKSQGEKNAVDRHASKFF